MMKQSAVYITRCDIGWYSKNANAYLKPLEIAQKYRMTLCVCKDCRVPREIEDQCEAIVRFGGLRGLLKPHNALNVRERDLLFTGFDFPCMYKAWQLKKKFGCKWTIFLWDPPCLSHRDRFPPLRWLIDALFRFFARRCDRLVLNIHPGLLDEIGYKPSEGQLELRMQDAWEGEDFSSVENIEPTGEDCFEYDFGVLANWADNMGGDLVVEALKRHPDKKCLWIGNPPKRGVFENIYFVGRLQQEAAFAMLRRCRTLIVPYPPTRVFKWNYPLKFFEYLSLGRNVIASDNPGNVDIAKRFSERVTLFSSGDTQSLAETMSR